MDDSENEGKERGATKNNSGVITVEEIPKDSYFPDKYIIRWDFSKLQKEERIKEEVNLTTFIKFYKWHMAFLGRIKNE